jgi:hypothetical protein
MAVVTPAPTFPQTLLDMTQSGRKVTFFVKVYDALI